MVVLLVALTFLVFVVIDLVRERRLREALLREGETVHGAVGAMEPQWVSGFQLKPALAYHPGHLWVHRVSGDQGYVGLDDFARRLAGPPAHVAPFEVGTHVNQGDRVAVVEREGSRIPLLSPVSGEIVGVNPRLKNEPDLPFKDPYGNGWLCKIRSPRMFAELSNLMSGSLANRWMQDTGERFRHRLMLAHGSVIQDGGDPVENIASQLGSDDWRRLGAEFLGLKPSEWN
jgi:glycine cleavage system H protein